MKEQTNFNQHNTNKCAAFRNINPELVTTNAKSSKIWVPLKAKTSGIKNKSGKLHH